jgi:hypothetical protein
MVQKTNSINNANIFNSVKVAIEPTTLIGAQSRFESDIAVSEQPLQWLANAIDMAISDALYREPTNLEIKISDYQKPGNVKSVTSIAEMFILCAKVAIGARVFQVSGARSKFDKKNFEYVSLLGPVLGMYGVYHDSVEAYDIIPRLGEGLKKELKEVGAITKNDEFTVPDWYQQCMLLFRRFHLMTNYGLPKEITVESNQCFKLTVSDNCVIGKPGASTAEVLLAALVHSSKLTDLFGAYRTLYTGISTLRTTFESIGLKALHDLEYRG